MTQISPYADDNAKFNDDAPTTSDDPFYSEEKKLRRKLIDNKIYVATYWPNVLEWTDRNSIESNYVNMLIALPIDQRCNHNMMENIIKIVNTIEES